MKAALDGLGWIAPVIENKRTGYLIDGHERVMQALAANAPVPYVVIDLDEDEEAEALATFDPIAGLAMYDGETLNALVSSVDIQSDAIRQMLNELTFDAQYQVGFLIPSESNERQLGDKAKQVKVALYVNQVKELENAITATGITNRGEAITEICRAYLDEKRQLDF